MREFALVADKRLGPPPQRQGYVLLPPRDQDALREAIYSQGPVAVGIDAAHLSFRFYLSGVYNNPLCCVQQSSACIDHLVGAVGYG